MDEIKHIQLIQNLSQQELNVEEEINGSLQKAKIESVVRECIEKYGFKISDTQKGTIVNKLADHFLIEMEAEPVITNEFEDEDWKPWLEGKRDELSGKWHFHTRSMTHSLKREGALPKKVMASHDATTDLILDRLGDPTSDYRFDRRGLAFGLVQSGKTMNYSMLIFHI